MTFFIFTTFILVKYSRTFVKRPSQGISSLALRLTTMNLDQFGTSLESYAMWSTSTDTNLENT